jgi:rod shape-determining protein MreC
MRNLINFIIKNHFVILFLIIESVSIALLVQYNNYQKTKVLNRATAFSGSLHKNFNSVTEYFNLRTRSEKLLKENTQLRNQLARYKNKPTIGSPKNDSIYARSQYIYIPAKVVNNSINKQFNYITINKGKKDSVQGEMAVISSDGIVGITRGVSLHYATVISLLNRNLRISAKIKKNGYYGSLHWEGDDYRHVSLKDIPYHVAVEVGDTIVTSGYSAIFPPNILIGQVSDFEIEGGNFYKIKVKLSTNYKNLSYIYVVWNKMKEERIELEEIEIKE